MFTKKSTYEEFSDTLTTGSYLIYSHATTLVIYQIMKVFNDQARYMTIFRKNQWMSMPFR